MLEERRSYNKGGQTLRYDPINTEELVSSPLSKQCFENVGCFGFCELVQRVKYYANLTSLFPTHLRKDKVTIAGVSFTISTEFIAIAIGIPNNGKKYSKSQDLDLQNYQPFIKVHYKHNIMKVFPFGKLLEIFYPAMRVIMKYFTCEGIFSRLYKYHVRLLMNFTRVKPLNLSYYLYKGFNRMAKKVQHRQTSQ